MAPRPLEIVAGFLGAQSAQSGEIDLVAAVDGTAAAAATSPIAEDAEILFEAPDGGFVGAMAGPFRGPEGWRAGFREWVAPYDSFVVEPQELIEVGEDRVLVLVQSRARLAGSGAEIDQPSGALYTVADGRIVRIEHFLDQEQARRAARLGDGEPDQKEG